MNGGHVDRPSAAVERLARWWTSASKVERFWLAKRVIEGDAEAPSFGTFQIAIYLSEAEAGEITT